MTTSQHARHRVAHQQSDRVQDRPGGACTTASRRCGAAVSRSFATSTPRRRKTNSSSRRTSTRITTWCGRPATCKSSSARSPRRAGHRNGWDDRHMRRFDIASYIALVHRVRTDGVACLRAGAGPGSCRGGARRGLPQSYGYTSGAAASLDSLQFDFDLSLPGTVVSFAGHFTDSGGAHVGPSPAPTRSAPSTSSGGTCS